jgi:hypothetical protein
MVTFSTTALILVIIGAAAIAYGIGRYHNLEQRVRELEKNYGHTVVGRVQHDAAEAALFQVSRAWAEQQIASEHLKYTRGLLVHISKGGDPDAKPDKWLKNDVDKK